MTDSKRPRTVVAKNVQVSAVYAHCGGCGEGLTSPGGSELIEVVNETTKGKTLTCGRCGALNQLPQRVYKTMNAEKNPT